MLVSSLNRKCLLLLIFSLLLIQISISAAAQKLQREATPAIVNPVLRSSFSQTISLDGKWDFAIDQEKKGEEKQWYRADVPLPNKRDIKVPGCWEAQGVGEPGFSHGKRMVFEAINRRIRAAYIGSAWYKKTMNIPANWAGKRVWIKFGGINSAGWIWVNGKFVAKQYEYTGAYKYDITDLVTAGQSATVAVLVCNDIPSLQGESQCVRTYGGLYRSVELEATGDVFVDYAYVQGNLDTKSAAVHATIRSEASKSSNVKVEVQLKTLKGKKAGKASKSVTVEAGKTTEVVFDIPVKPFKAWSPENPNLYRADIVLKEGGKAVHGWIERFGVKKIESRDGKIFLNNRPYFLRGAGDDHVYAITICSPADRQQHRKNLQTARDFGFNYFRTHTHTEVPEYYHIADELGIMIQAELPYWGMNNIIKTHTVAHMSGGEVKPREDLLDLVHHYRRYTSLATYCFGNEGDMADTKYKIPPESCEKYFDPNNIPSLDIQLYQMAKKLDPTRLVVNNDGGYNTPENSDIHQSNSFYLHDPNEYHSPSHSPLKRTMTYDFYDWPHVNHEYTSYSVQEDPRLATKYTGGFLPNLTMEKAEKQLVERGISWDWVEATLDAGYRLQAIQRKFGIETARLDPHNDGYVIWLLTDISPNSQNGVLNLFYEPKFVSPTFFRQYNGPSVIIARGLPQAPIYSSGDQIKFRWVLSHFDETPLANCRIEWTLVDGEQTLANGQTRIKHIPAGKLAELAKVDITVPSIAKPTKACLTAYISGTDIRNSYDIWLFPQRKAFDSKGSSLAGICVSSDVYSKLKNRYPDMVKGTDSAAQKADVILVDQLTESVIDLLNKGKTVITVMPVLGLDQKADVNLVDQSAESVIDLLNKDKAVITVIGPKQITDGILIDKLTETVIDLLKKGNTFVTVNPYLSLQWHQPGHKLGWWVRSTQSGSAIIHPEAFGRFPHSGVLDQLMFDVSANALMWQDNLRDVEPLMFGSGGSNTTYEDPARLPNYFMYGFQARVGSGKLLLSGFDFMADRPESICLLDEFIRYASSDSFQPKGTFDPSGITLKLEINGWSKTTEAPEKTDYYSFMGQLPMNLVRQTDGKKTLRWLTAAVPDDVKNKDQFVFRFFAITGYETDPAGGKFSFYLSDPEKPKEEPTHLLDFDHTMKSAKWSGMEGKVNLDYEVLGNRAGQDSSGIMELSLPASLLTPGKPVELKVVGSSSDSRRYFGIYTVSLILFQDGKMNKKQ